MTWRAFAPRRPIGPSDHFGTGGRLAWNAVQAFVGPRFPSTVDPQQIQDFSDSLIDSGVAHRSFMPGWGLGGSWLDLDPTVESQQAAPGRASNPHHVVGLHPLSSLTDLKELVVYAIWSTTFLHSWVGGSQFQDGGDARLAPLGTRSTSLSDVTDFWDARGPLPEHAGFQIALAQLIGAVDWGTLAKAGSEPDSHVDEYGALLKALDDEVAAARGLTPSVDLTGYSTAKIKGRINT